MTVLACLVAGAFLGGLVTAIVLVPMMLHVRRERDAADAEAAGLARYIVALTAANTRLSTALAAARVQPLPEEIIT